MTRYRSWQLLALPVLLAGCHGDRLGSNEPIRVHGGTFIEGALPGLPALTDAEVMAGQMPTGSHVTLVESANNVLRAGEANKHLSGRVDTTSTSLGLKLDGAGEGYWVVPLGPPDPMNHGEFTWSLSLDVATNAAPGLHDLLFAGLDAAGNAGTLSALRICITAPGANDLSVCDDTVPPPAAVLSLSWDRDVDLDLVVYAPNGSIADPKHPTTAKVDEHGVPQPEPGDGVFDHDAMPGCVKTGGHREDLIFADKPKPGTYYVFASLFDACGNASARFDFSLSLSSGAPARLAEVLHQSGEVLASQADGGAGLGTYVTEFTIQ